MPEGNNFGQNEFREVALTPGPEGGVSDFASLSKEQGEPLREISHAGVLMEKLDKGEYLDAFDGSSIQLLERILNDPEKSGVAASSAFGKIAGWLIPKAAGVGAGALVMKQGSPLVGSKVAGYLRERMLFKESTEVVPPIVPSPEVPSGVQGLRETLNSLFDNARDFLAHGAQKVKEGAEGASNYASEAFIERVAQPAAEVLSKPPLAIGGFLLGAGIVGGGVSVYRAMRERASFTPIMENIKESEAAIQGDEKPPPERDPRLQLVAYFEGAAQNPEHLGHKLSSEEWIAFAGAARAARVDILRQMTRAPQIVAGAEGKRALEKQHELVETVARGQNQIAEADRGLAVEILAQFNQKLRNETDPIKKKIAGRNDLLPKLRDYSAAFTKGGLEATGIPTAWRIARSGFRVTHKAARIATLGAIP